MLYGSRENSSMSADVFVSYSSQDRDRVIPVVDYLRSSGISVWVDEGNIHAADLWSEQIVQAIASCRVLVVMLSGNSTDSHNVIKEAMLASEQKKVLLPVYLEPAEIPAKLQYHKCQSTCLCHAFRNGLRAGACGDTKLLAATGVRIRTMQVLRTACRHSANPEALQRVP